MAGFTRNYVGRVVDLSITPELPPNGLTPVELDFGDQPMVVAGPQKAAQLWAIHFLTRRGTVAGDEDFGTDFMSGLQRGEFRTEIDVEQAFTAAVQDIRNYQLERQADSSFSDEVVTKGELLDGWEINRAESKLDLRVGLTLQSGKLLEVLIPVPVVII